MYSLSIAVTSFLGDDGITAQLLHCFKSYLYRIAPTFDNYILFTYTFQVKSTKNVYNVKTDKSFSDLSVFLLILFQITIHSYPTGVKFFTALFLPNID